MEKIDLKELIWAQYNFFKSKCPIFLRFYLWYHKERIRQIIEGYVYDVTQISGFMFKSNGTNYPVKIGEKAVDHIIYSGCGYIYMSYVATYEHALRLMQTQTTTVGKA